MEKSWKHSSMEIFGQVADWVIVAWFLTNTTTKDVSTTEDRNSSSKALVVSILSPEKSCSGNETSWCSLWACSLSGYQIVISTSLFWLQNLSSSWRGLKSSYVLHQQMRTVCYWQRWTAYWPDHMHGGWSDYQYVFRSYHITRSIVTTFTAILLWYRLVTNNRKLDCEAASLHFSYVPHYL